MEPLCGGPAGIRTRDFRPTGQARQVGLRVKSPPLCLAELRALDPRLVIRL